MKKYHCCMPGCNTYDTLGNFLSIPVSNSWRKIWLSAIPRKNWVVDHSTIACAKHFKSSDIVVYSATVADKQDKKSTTNTLIPVMNQGAVPSFFPKTINPDNDPNKIYFPPEMFELASRDCSGPDTFEDLENSETTDFIVDYWYLKLMYPKRLKPLLEDTWAAVSTLEYTTFYIVDFSEIPRIPVSIKIGNNLHVNVTLAGKTMDPIDLTWILPINGKLNRWSQLHLMLTILGQN